MSRFDNAEESSNLMWKLREHVVDSTGLLTVTLPTFAAAETWIAGMSNAQSLGSRGLAVMAAYGGLGYIYGKGRDAFFRWRNINDETPLRIRGLHDKVYGSLFQLAVSPPWYYAAGWLGNDPMDFPTMAKGAAVATAYGLVFGDPIGVSIDTYRELTDTKEVKYIPENIRNMPKVMKRFAAAALISLAVSGMFGIYEFNNWRSDDNTTEEISQAEQKVELNTLAAPIITN